MPRKGRPVSGILLLDKPAGETSNRALQRVRRLLQARKAGHTGSLDPLATGLLPLCFGEATKVSGCLLDASKRYEVTARFGVTTDTADAEGETLERRPVPALDRPGVEAALAGLRGEQDQVPPMYSAVKHQGRRLYELARSGVEVPRAARRITVHALELAWLAGEEAGLRVHCSKGTYVRTLVADLGEALGCGAHVTALRRTALGPFEAPGMVTLETLEQRAADGPAALDELLLPPDTAIADWPAVVLGPETAPYLRQGQAVWIPRAPAPGAVRLYGPEGFLGMGLVLDDGRVAPRRLLAVPEG
ncbi:tRNA pseudouridine(55) synthase TruB [Sediminicurvatus halobius]|uniref:tRNA pseudouridine synthase B n=1 Tax=Sediminicurvatus halobius TaxID=2182432 RepID=A0A2U2N2Y3_9GAMM|nr:tRNA pseudouridine(55) synthase TruB [Spiribacter halobius]PWG63566.1 tRNA pseudouridine(55) synthase TruB [Spiribacter halobius]UEX79555.1 tRNA pseudouridine(55) synthase TruB [Spiribacter halobius]